MNDVKNFVKQWSNVDGERANYQKFWLTFIRDVFGIDKPENFIQFEVPVKLELDKLPTAKAGGLCYLQPMQF